MISFLIKFTEGKNPPGKIYFCIKSSLFLSSGYKFERQDLPNEAQYAPIYAFEFIQKNQTKGILVGGNQYLVKPQFGKHDASKGWYIPYELINNKLKWKSIKSLRVNGQIRQINWLESLECLLVGLNDKELNCYEFE